MTRRPSVALTFDNLYGMPSWCVKRGYGSFLTLEFGEPHLETGPILRVRQEPPRRVVVPHGEWHLWVYCCAWSIRQDGRTMATWRSSNRKIERATRFLNGQALTRISVQLERTRCTFEFDLGGSLVTWPYDSEGEQWILYMPGGQVWSLRADSTYSFGSRDARTDEEIWLPLDLGTVPDPISGR